MKVLLAADGRPHTEKAVDYAIEYASRYKAELFVVYVLGHGVQQMEAWAEGKRTLQAIKLKALSREVGLITMLEDGEPAESIMRVAEKIGADLIILGASGRCEGMRRPLGSVSGKVASDACCSIMIIR